ncbi:AT-rich interactive domain-containing protein 2-like isoform X1 [Vigna umbellata]|uniref:AT-rich interactive domain-containing protein 2-like isoform X1 n=2 Tax=Vigna umbellata TaxID=87088 RepID=UPI001F5FBBF0|nr:AT-rich interactive domain-containing protein 2-like isoform X1 [Vigna umbellata]
MSMAGRLQLYDGVREEDSGEIFGGSKDDSLCRFERLFAEFFSEICAFNCVLHYPPMLSDGQDVDLYRLFLVVRGKGGYDAVCKGKLWDSVGEESGMGVSVGSSVELVYSRYLSALDSWMKKVAESKVSPEFGVVDDRDKFGRRLMELQAEVEGLLSGCADERVVLVGEDVEGGLDEDDHNLDGRELSGANGVKSNGDEGGEHRQCDDSEMPDNDMDEAVLGNSDKGNDLMGGEEGFDGGKMPEEQAVDISDGANKSGTGVVSGGKQCDDSDDKGLVLDASGGNSDDDSSGHKRKREGSVWDSSSDDCDSPSRKRMRESAMDMLSWITGVAKDPGDPEVGSIPEKSKWKSYSSQEVWKQVLLFREATFYRRGSEASNEQRNWQNQKMHPCLYEEQVGTNYNLRDRLKCDKKLLFGKSASVRSSSDSSLATENRTPGSHTEGQSELRDSPDANSGLDKCATVRIPLGTNHQAEIPEWTGVTSESDSKWLGTRIWPQETVNTRLIERDPIGKGRQGSCGCPEEGSVECVRFHISEKRAKVKLELGNAFYDWDFDRVGEEVRLMWTKEEEKKFEDVVRSNPPSLEKYYWDYIFRAFPDKSRAELVSYYFNVFILQRRGYQNRHTPDDIDSDDNDDEAGPLRNVFGPLIQNSGHEMQSSRGSSLLTPKKTHKKGK